MIAQLIVWEGETLLESLWWGMIFALEYDTIRVFRRIIRHRHLWVMCLEDVIYWIYIAFKAFFICFDVNDGMVRAFILLGFAGGAFLFSRAFGKIYIKYASFIGIFLLKPLKRLFSGVKIILYKAGDRGRALSNRVRSHILRRAAETKLSANSDKRAGRHKGMTRAKYRE